MKLNLKNKLAMDGAWFVEKSKIENPSPKHDVQLFNWYRGNGQLPSRLQKQKRKQKRR